MNPGNTQHGHCKKGNISPTYQSWRSFHNRCTNPNQPDYYKYKDMYYPPWADFLVFLSDLGERPPNTTLDRIDNTKGYSPENCRWATRKQQARNTKQVKMSEEKAASIRQLRDQGIKPKEISTMLGIHPSTVCNIYFDRAWT